jgi:hypothetical protein
MKPHQTDPVEEFILDNEHNLRIGAAVGESWPAARTKVVNGFLDRLEATLMRTLKGWESQRDDFFTKDRTGYYFWNPTWIHSDLAQYYLALQAQRFGTEMAFGVMRFQNADFNAKTPVL